MKAKLSVEDRPRLGRTRSRASKVLTQLFAAAVVAVPFGAVPASAEYNYSCGDCSTINGREENLNYNEGTNYSNTDVCVTIWKNNGGGNFNTVGHNCETGSYTDSVCSSAGTVYGHGEVYNGEAGAHMAGHQDTRC